MVETASNSLLSTSTSDSSLSVQLHPLVLLTISDYITRHSMRSQQGPIIGAIIGQQNGRTVTMEQAFQCKIKEDGDKVLVDEEWFAERLEQFKDVHKSPPLDLVAIFTLAPPSGPLPDHVPILQQLQHSYNDSLMLLLFHPQTILDGSLTGGKLPISIYESYYEPGSENADKGMQVEGWGMGRQLQMRFRQLPFEVETGEAEMIAVDFVAKGSGSAAVQNSATPASKGKSRAEGSAATNDVQLSSADEEVISSLTAKYNAIKMLHQRINLIKAYLAELPQSYLTDASISAGTSDPPLNHQLLREISSMLSRLPLLAPPVSQPSTTIPVPGMPQSSLATASSQEQSDVHMVSLLASLTRTVAQAKDMGSKYSIVQKAKTDRNNVGMMGGGRGFSNYGPGPGDDPWGTPGESNDYAPINL
ncbi:COP9 signalosome-like protein subunit 6, partial [Aureobasidium melanogenum]|uniref:COP9 signalosome complex subunit 6 n=1 Tax=Aureobasidium melanogenum (strain CBS 110374) TaxID=1043003 RepID=A0A074WVV1_AURM1